MKQGLRTWFESPDAASAWVGQVTGGVGPDEGVSWFLDKLPRGKWVTGQISGIELPDNEFLIRVNDHEVAPLVASSLPPGTAGVMPITGGIDLYPHGDNFILSTVGLTHDILDNVNEPPAGAALPPQPGHDGAIPMVSDARLIRPYARALTNMGMGYLDYQKIEDRVTELAHMRHKYNPESPFASVLQNPTGFGMKPYFPGMGELPEWFIAENDAGGAALIAGSDQIITQPLDAVQVGSDVMVMQPRGSHENWLKWMFHEGFRREQ